MNLDKPPKITSSNKEGVAVEAENETSAAIEAVEAGTAWPSSEGMKSEEIRTAFETYLQSLPSNPEEAAKFESQLQHALEFVDQAKSGEHPDDLLKKVTTYFAIGGVGASVCLALVHALLGVDSPVSTPVVLSLLTATMASAGFATMLNSQNMGESKKSIQNISTHLSTLATMLEENRKSAN